MDCTLANIYKHPDFEPTDLTVIVNAHRQTSFKKGDMILKVGQKSNKYYCLVNGWVRSYAISSEGEEITTGFFGTNDIVIEVASLFLRVPTKENLQALTDCECWEIDFESFQMLFHSVKGFMEWGRSWMSGQLLKSKLRSISMITDSATDRYIELQKEHPDLLLKIPLKYIASYLGVTDTSLSRIRKEISNSERK